MNLKLSSIKIGSLLLLIASLVPEQLQAASAPAAAGDFDIRPITARNIFDPNRRPNRPSEPRTVRPAVDTFSFTGTMNYSKGLFAFFDGTSSDYRKVVEKGDKIAGYTVQEIEHDLIKLALDTNQVQLKVGMQMRRSEDGKWSPGEGSFNGGSAGSNSRWNSSRSRSNNSFSDRDRGSRDDSRSRNLSRWQSDNNQSRNFTRQQVEVPASGIVMPVDGAAAADPSDPVARLMLNRLRETGENPANMPGNQNDSGNENGSATQAEPGNQNTTEPPNESLSQDPNTNLNANDNPNPSNEN
jgi:hypothetical protein